MLNRNAVTDISLCPGCDENRLLSVRASVELESETPLAKAVITEAKERGIRQRKAEDFLSVNGAGLQATVDGKMVLVGKRPFLPDNVVTGWKELTDRANRLAEQARSLVWVARGGCSMGVIVRVSPRRE